VASSSPASRRRGSWTPEMMPVYQAYETYFRGEGDLLVETGKHVLLAALPAVGTELTLRFYPAHAKVKVVGIEMERKIIVEPV
jgi:hypothetical protein